MILHCIFRLFNVVLKFYYCIFIRLFKCNSSGKFLMQINFLRYRAPMETSLRAEWASLCKSSFTLLYFTSNVGKNFIANTVPHFKM